MKPNTFTGPVATLGMRPINLHDCTRKEIQEYFENNYALEEWLFSSLKDEEVFYKTPDRLRLPLIFYYAHPAVVFVNKFLLAGITKDRIDANFESLFETGVDEMSWDDTENFRMGGEYKWPPVEEVRQYRLKVRKMVTNVIETMPLTTPIDQDSKWWAVLMCIAHDVIHTETSSVLIRQLPVDMLEKPEHWTYAPLHAKTPILINPMLTTGNVDVTMGKDRDSLVYGWDNEYGKRTVRVPKIEVSKYPVTNREFLEFVEAGGYENNVLWSSEGWKWRTFRQAKHPTFWVCSKKCKSGCGSTLHSYSHCNKEENEDKYSLRVMFDVLELPLDWPVVANYHEAKAFCKWKGEGYRITTEAEQHVIRSLPPFDASKETFANKKPQSHNIGLVYGSSAPVDRYPPSPSGFCDTFGNVWEWVEDHFNGFPGSETHYLYDDFTTPCYDGKHNCLVGGSWISCGDEAQRYGRYNFRRHFYQHIGFRLARTVDLKDPSPVVYVNSPVYMSGFGVGNSETDLEETVSQGLQPISEESMSHCITGDTEKNTSILVHKQYLSQESSEIPISLLEKYFSTFPVATSTLRALVIGCGPGRIAFELSKVFDQVIACDTSGRCIDFAIKLAKEGSALPPTNETANDETYQNKDTKTVIKLPAGTKTERVTFKQMTWIPAEFGEFDLVVVDGLDRVQNQKAWLAIVPNVLKNKNSLAIILHPRDEVEVHRLGLNHIELNMTLNGIADNIKPPHVKTPNVSIWQKR